VSSVPHADGLPPGRRRIAYLAMALATTMATLDVNIANTALPTIARDLHVSASASIWVVNAYQLASVGALFTFAALGQLRGPARIYRIGVLVFIAGSLACALSPSLGILLASRVLQGLGASAVMSIGPALLREIFPRAQLGRALGLNAMVVASSTAAGPAFGGFILALAPWPWIYAINVPFGLANVALNRALPHDDRNEGRLDLPSVLTSAGGFTLLIWGVGAIARAEPAWSIAVRIALGLGAFAWFGARQRTLARPMLAVDLFRIPTFTLAGATSFTAFTAQGLAYVSLPYFFQRALGTTPLDSALLMTSWPVALAVAGPLAGRLSDRFSPALLSTCGLAIFAGGLALYATLPEHPAVAHIVLNGAICGLGFGIFKSPNDRELMMSAPREKSSSASGVLAAVRVSGQTAGAALVAIVFAAFGGAVVSTQTSGVIAHAAPVALWLGTLFAVVATLASGSRIAASHAGRRALVAPGEPQR
jgi:DHA2 family multidrug resistance protein-like MFS transporter